MSKYRILMHPNGSQTWVPDDEFENIDEAVRFAMSFGTDDFAIIQFVNWKATEAPSHE